MPAIPEDTVAVDTAPPPEPTFGLLTLLSPTLPRDWAFKLCNLG